MQRLRLLISFRQNLATRQYSTMALVKTQAAAMDFLSFVNASPTPYHAVKSAKERLSKAGFEEIKVGNNTMKRTHS
jgi:aspartyl aminopeptidase